MTAPCFAARTMFAVLVVSLCACSGERPTDLGVADSRLAPCPSSPNCVSSHATDKEHRIAALELAVEPAEAWKAVREVVSELSRTRIITATDDYLHAECTSRLMRFVDDLELQLVSDRGTIAVRSASRVGHSDLGVNRERVESLRASLAARGVVRTSGAE